MLNIIIHVNLIQKCKQKSFGSLQQMPPTDKSFECLSLHTVDEFLL